MYHFDAKTCVIGDTIGGITGPISGFLGATLACLALKEQIKANKIITDHLKSKKCFQLTDQLQMLREDIKDYLFLEFHPGYEDEYFEGSEAI